MAYPSLSWLIAPNGEQYIDESQKGTAFGVASLDGNKKLSAATVIQSIVLVSGGKTLGLSDGGTIQRCTGSTDIVITVPLNNNTPFPIGTMISIYRASTADVSIVGESGVIIESRSPSQKLESIYSLAYLTKMDQDTWALTGDVSVPLYPSSGE